MTTYTINLDAAGDEIDVSAASRTGTAGHGSFPAMTYGDVSHRKASLDADRDPERALHQAEVNELADRTYKAEEFALRADVFDKETGQPRPGHEREFARRMAVATELRTQTDYALTVGNNAMKARGGNAPFDPAVADLRAQLAEQEAARAERHAAKIAARSR